jgi:hypothetical protein
MLGLMRGRLAGGRQLAIKRGRRAAQLHVPRGTSSDIQCPFVARSATRFNDLRQRPPTLQKDVGTKNKDLRRVDAVSGANVPQKCPCEISRPDE